MRGVAAALAVPVVFVLIVRFIMITIFQTGLENRNADNLLKGLIQGVLMYHAVLSTKQAITGALFLGVCGRLVSDFVMQRDSWKVACTLLGIAFGVLMADVVSYLYEDSEWSALTFIDDITSVRGERQSHGHSTRRRVSEPRRIEELPAVYEELSSIDSQSRVGNEELSEPDREVARLRAKALHAAGQRRKFREERKWALSQGNLARAFQLRWQVKKYHALAVSYTREADQKLIEADRARRVPVSPSLTDQRLKPESIPPAPFVQVVVEGGHNISESDIDDHRQPKESRRPHITARTLVSKAEVSRQKTGVHIESRGSILMQPGRDNRPLTAIESPPTSDTWSRQLD